MLDDGSRVTVVGPDGILARVFRLPGYVTDIHALGTGEFVAVSGVPSLSREENVVGMVRYPHALWRYDAGGARQDSIGQTAGYEEYMFCVEGRCGSRVPMFAKTSHVAARGSTILRGDADRMQIEEMSWSGKLLRILRIPDYPLGLSAATVAAERMARQGSNPTPRRRQIEEQSPVPEERPAYSQIVVDTERAIWLRPFLGRSERGRTETWQALDSTGAWLGGVEVMEGLQLRSIGSDWVLGVWTDSLGVEHPRMHRLRRES